MKIEIVTPEASIFEGEANLIQLPGYDGLFEILNNHAPMITFLGKGNVKIVPAKYDQDCGIIGAAMQAF